MARYFDRYSNFRFNGGMRPLPGLNIPENPSDKYVQYRLGDTRLDKLSNSYYNSPYYGWLIMLANPQYGGLEFLIPDQSIIRIPFPFESAIDRYIQTINRYNTLYGQ
jgi:hypothetical protein